MCLQCVLKIANWRSSLSALETYLFVREVNRGGQQFGMDEIITFTSRRRYIAFDSLKVSILTTLYMGSRKALIVAALQGILQASGSNTLRVKDCPHCLFLSLPSPNNTASSPG